MVIERVDLPVTSTTGLSADAFLFAKAIITGKAEELEIRDPLTGSITQEITSKIDALGDGFDILFTGTDAAGKATARQFLTGGKPITAEELKKVLTDLGREHMAILTASAAKIEQMNAAIVEENKSLPADQQKPLIEMTPLAQNPFFKGAKLTGTEADALEVGKIIFLHTVRHASDTLGLKGDNRVNMNDLAPVEQSVIDRFDLAMGLSDAAPVADPKVAADPKANADAGKTTVAANKLATASPLGLKSLIDAKLLPSPATKEGQAALLALKSEDVAVLATKINAADGKPIIADATKPLDIAGRDEFLKRLGAEKAIATLGDKTGTPGEIIELLAAIGEQTVRTANSIPADKAVPKFISLTEVGVLDGTGVIPDRKAGATTGAAGQTGAANTAATQQPTGLKALLGEGVGILKNLLKPKTQQAPQMDPMMLAAMQQNPQLQQNPQYMQQLLMQQQLMAQQGQQQYPATSQDPYAQMLAQQQYANIMAQQSRYNMNVQNPYTSGQYPVNMQNQRLSGQLGMQGLNYGGANPYAAGYSPNNRAGGVYIA